MGRMRSMLTLGVPGLMGGGPINTVAPAITADSVIGTENTATPGTWTGNPVLTYQWQRYTGGAWANISGATSTAYTPADADFGLSLRIAEIPNGIAASVAYSNQTGLTAEVPAQSLGDSVVTDGSFEAGDTSAFTSSSGGVLTKENGARTGGAGSKVLRTKCLEGDSVAGASQACLVVGTLYQFYEWWISDGVGRLCVGTITLTGLLNGTSSGVQASWTKRYILFRADATTIQFGNNPTSIAVDSYLDHDDLTIQAVTQNAELVAPSANMCLDLHYVLPVAPSPGTKTRLQARISNAVLGNYWEAEPVYTGSQWNIVLYSVATFTRTSRISATNVGATVGIRVNMNADSISLYTTANGTDWTQCGTTITNNTYQTAVGVNALWTSDVTPGNLVYAVAV